MEEFKGALGHYWIWKPANIPSTTPVFSFNYCDWRLELKRNRFWFWLDLVNERMSWRFRPFKVTCFSRLGKLGSQEASGTFQTECKSGSSYLIWKATSGSVYANMRCSKWNSQSQFVVFLHKATESPFDINSADDQCTYTTSSLKGLSSDMGKLLESGEAADVHLKCNGTTRSAHRSVLAARSEVFAAMFRNKMTESTSGVVDVNDLDAALLDSFLRYVYTGNLSDIPEGRMQELYAVADKYAVHSLKKLCSTWMIENLSADNYDEFLYIANTHSDRKLKTDLIASIIDHPQWLKYSKWLEFSDQNADMAIEVYHELFYQLFK